MGDLLRWFVFEGGSGWGGFLIDSLSEREVGRGKEREGGGWMFPSLVTMFRLTWLSEFRMHS